MGGSGAIGVKLKKKWRLFRATDYTSLMWPCFVMSRIYGLFPYKLTTGTFIIVSSRLGYIYSSIVNGLFISLVTLILYQVNIGSGLSYEDVPASLQGHCYLLLGSSVALISYFMSNKRMRLLSDLAEISSRLPASSFNRITRIIHAKDIIGFLFLAAQTPNIRSNDALTAILKILYMYITLVVYLMDTLYVDSVCVLGACFERINENLLALKESIDKEDPHLLRRIYHEQKNPLLIMEIRAMKKQHNDVSEVVQRLNAIFSLQMVATVTLTFAEITFSLYFYILTVIGNKQANLDQQIWFMYFITSVTYYAVKMASIVWGCETARGHAMKTGIVVHEVLIDTTDKQVKEELQLFSLQLLHRDNTFQAKGLTLDATLITSIVGGITTYLLILIQFLVSSKSCGAVVNKSHMATMQH